MDNRVFNVNGSGKALLQQALSLAFKQWSDKATATSYFIDKTKGLVLLWYTEKNSIPFPSPLTSDEATEVIWSWLQSKAAKEVECVDWDANHDHDGSNGDGWRVYCEGWGHVKSHYAIVAVKPAFMWYGK